MSKLEELEILNKEHDVNNGIETKKVSMFGYDLDNSTTRRIAVDENGIVKQGGFSKNANLTITKTIWI
jgi:hypothetical protein